MRKALMTMLALAVTIPLAACAQEEPARPFEQPVGTTGTASEMTETELEEIAEEPGEYYGKVVTVAGSIGDVHSQRLFTLREEGIIDLDDSLLVLAPEGTNMRKMAGGYDAGEIMVVTDTPATVRGTVRVMNREEIERDYGIADWVELGIDESTFFTDYGDRPVLVAEHIDVRS